ncbi:MAG: methyltransferase domain-containing protein [Pseudomonadales bacterium]
MDYQRYHQLRSNQDTFFGYGLQRRYAKIAETIEELLPKYEHPIEIADFGCAEGYMLQQLLDTFEGRINFAHGFDLFKQGVPSHSDKIQLTPVNLFYDYPFPLADESIDICYASAFFKHHPKPAKFLAQINRILKPDGKLLLSDPCSATLRIGLSVGYFDRNWMPNRWSRKSLAQLLESSPQPLDLTLVEYERYWIAPSKRVFDMGIERWLPSALRKTLGLHQLAVLEKRRAHSPEVQPTDA